MTALHDARVTPIWRFGDAPVRLGRCVVTIGVFDGVHQGHARLIGRAVDLAGGAKLPAVLVTFDPHPALVVGRRRDVGVLTTVGQRADLAGELGIDAVCVLPFTRELARLAPLDFVEQVLVRGLHAESVVVGANFTFGHRAQGDIGTLNRLSRQHGLRAESVRLLQDADRPYSSTRIRELIRRGDLTGAAEALGRPHTVAGMLDAASSPSVATSFHTVASTVLPPSGDYHCLLDDGAAAIARIDESGHVTVRVDARARRAASLRFLSRQPGPTSPRTDRQSTTAPEPTRLPDRLAVSS
jgi:riboflavin kinase/FMN adenylyltransferase